MKRIARIETLKLPDGRQIGIKRHDGRGAPLVLLHGFLDSAEGWDQLAAATHRPCVAIDLPGFGRSHPPTRARVDAYAEDVATSIDMLGIGRCTLIGHSLGGAVATATAEHIGERFSSLILLAPAGFGNIHIAAAAALPGVKRLVASVSPLFLANPLMVSAVYLSFVTNRAMPSPELVTRIMRRSLRAPAGVRIAVEAIAASGLSKRAFHKRTIDYDGPVYALWGENDMLVPISHTGGLADAIPHARIFVWKDMGHHPQRERPVELSDFVENVCLRARRDRRRRNASIAERRREPIDLSMPLMDSDIVMAGVYD